MNVGVFGYTFCYLLLKTDNSFNIYLKYSNTYKKSSDLPYILTTLSVQLFAFGFSVVQKVANLI